MSLKRATGSNNNQKATITVTLSNTNTKDNARNVVFNTKASIPLTCMPATEKLDFIGLSTFNEPCLLRMLADIPVLDKLTANGPRNHRPTN